MRTCLRLPLLLTLITMFFSVAISHQYCEKVSTLDDLGTCCDACSGVTAKDKQLSTTGSGPAGLSRRGNTIRHTIGKLTSFIRRPFSSSRSTPSPILQVERPPRHTSGRIVGLTRKGELYAAQIFIGDHRQSVEVIVDTGRTDTAIVLPPPNFSRKSSYHSGVALEDKVDLGGHLVQQRFWSMSKLSIELGDEYESNVEGVLAMAPNRNSAGLGGRSFPRNVQLLSLPQKVYLNVFALWLSYSIRPQLHLSWIDEAVYTGDIEYHQIVNPGDLWMIENGQIHVNDEIVLSGFMSIIDSGTPFIYGPFEDVKKIYQSLGGLEIEKRYYFPCRRLRSVSFSWNNLQQWYIPNDVFTYSRFTRSEAGSVAMCAGAIQYRSGLGKGEWRIGTWFLRGVYTVFDVKNKKVGFGKLRMGI